MTFISVSKQSRPGIFTYSSMLKVTTFCDIITCEGSDEVVFPHTHTMFRQAYSRNCYRNSHYHLTLKLSSPFS